MTPSASAHTRKGTGRSRHWPWRAFLLVYLLWLPLPFGSVTPAAWLPLTLPPFLLLAALGWSDRKAEPGWRFSPAAATWSLGTIAFAIFVLLQIVPLPPVVVRMLSTETHQIWSDAVAITNIAAPDLVPEWFHLSVNPSQTSEGLVGILARLALFVLGAQLFRSPSSRLVLAIALTASACAQVIYGIGHWSGPLVDLWGRDDLTDGRLSGTFVNPNHLGNYLAIILPLSLYLPVRAWYETRRERSAAERVEATLFRHTAKVLIGGAGLMVGIFGILLTKSRGSLLSLVVAFLIGLVLLFEETAARRNQRVIRTRRRVVWTAIALILVIGISIIHLGTERITKRMLPDREGLVTLAGRIEGSRLAVEVWKIFPIVGSGFDTFGDVSLMVAKEDRLHHSHAHNDWLEILATTGIAGGAIALLFLTAGLIAMARQIWPAMLGAPMSRASSGEWRRFAGLAAISVILFLLHSLVEFNFYIPANSYTLAVIAGATVAIPRER